VKRPKERSISLYQVKAARPVLNPLEVSPVGKAMLGIDVKLNSGLEFKRKIQVGIAKAACLAGDQFGSGRRRHEVNGNTYIGSNGKFEGSTSAGTDVFDMNTSIGYDFNRFLEAEPVFPLVFWKVYLGPGRSEGKTSRPYQFLPRDARASERGSRCQTAPSGALFMIRQR
jgi:hypothetical protein